MNTESQNVYNSILEDSKLMPLSLFKSNKFSKYNLFPHAHTLPVFFQNNLQNEGRIVKYLKGPEGAFRGFYYQLFKLGFEVDQTGKNYASIIKNVIFDPQLTAPSESPINGKQYNVCQYQRIIAEFIKIMQSQVIPNAELTFSQYPIIDESMLAILSIIVEKIQKESNKKIQTLTQLLTKLCLLFQITLQVYDNCYSFQESDVFLYAESPVSFYLAFLSEMAEVESIDQTSQSPPSQQFKEQFSSNSYFENKQDVSIYKDIRLSAGNRGTRAKVTNRNTKQNRSNVLLSMSDEHGSERSLKSGSQSKVSLENQEQKLQTHSKSLNKEKIQKEVYPHSSDMFPQYRNSQNLSTKNMPLSEIRDSIQHKTENDSTQKEIIESLDLISQPGLEQKNSALFHHANQGLNQVFESIHTYKSITDSLPESFDRVQGKMLKEIKDQKDILSKFAPNKVCQSIQYQPKQQNSQKKNLQISLNGKLFKYQFKSFNYEQNHRFESPTKDSEPQRNLNKNKQEDITSKQKADKQVLIHHQIKNVPKREIIEDIFKGRIKETPEKQFTPKISYEKLKNPLQSVDIQFYIPKQKYSSCSSPFVLNNYSGQNKEFLGNISANMGKKEETLGTFYRQFTDTRVMEIMEQPFKTKVKLTREKFKGIRSKNFKGFF